jgi:hypothetical protein
MFSSAALRARRQRRRRPFPRPIPKPIPKLVAWAGAVVIAGFAAACEGDPEAGAPLDDEAASMALRERMDDVLPRPEAVVESLPADRAAILRELAPLPSEALLVVYEVEGPGGVTGSLEVLARPGGLRRENWTIHVPLGEEGSRQLDGFTVQTPDGVWIEGSDAPTPSPLSALAEAWLALPEASRRAVVEELRAHRAALARSRAAETEPPEQILGVPCHVTRVATIEMCLWEAAGLPLRYASDGLRLRAIHIEEHASIGEHAFDPPGSARTKPAAAVAGLDAPAALRRAAEGDLAELAPWLHPGLRLPT